MSSLGDFLREDIGEKLFGDPIHLVPWESLYIIVLVLLLARILNGFLFKPVLAVLDERKRLLAQATGSQEETSRLLDAKSKEHAARLAAAWREATVAVEAAKRDAEGTRQQLVGEARQAAEKRVDEVKARIAAQSESARKELESSAKDLAKRMAGALLGREVA